MARSRRERATLIAAVLGLGIVLGGAVVGWSSLSTGYYLLRLRSDPKFLSTICRAPPDSPKGRAVAKYLRLPEGGAALLDEFLSLSLSVDPTNVSSGYEHPRENRWIVTWIDSRNLCISGYWNSAPPPDWSARGKRLWSGGTKGGGFRTNAGDAAGRLRDLLDLAGTHRVVGLTSEAHPGWEFSFVDPETEIRVPRWYVFKQKVYAGLEGVPFVLLARQAVPDGPWGVPGEGSQVRLRRWEPDSPDYGGLPVFLVDVRNLDHETLELVHSGELSTVIVDGEEYRKAEIGTRVLGQVEVLRRGEAHVSGPLVLDSGWRTVEGGEADLDRRPLSLAPGVHTIAVILGRYRNGQWLGDTTVTSNRLTIEIAGDSN